MKWCLWPSWGSTGVQSFLVNIVEKEVEKGEDEKGKEKEEVGGEEGRNEREEGEN